jgi:hypothetical protein
MARARLLFVWGDDPHVIAEVGRDRFEHRQAGGEDAVVVGEEDAHQAGASRVIPPI